MKKMKKILCGALAVLVVSAAGLICWQWENVKAVKNALQYSQEELEEQLQANQQVIQDAVNAAPEVTIRDVTEEERAALKDGTLTQQELIDRLVSDGTSSAPDPPVQTPPEAEQPAKPPAETPVQQAPVEEPVKPDPNYQQKLSAIIAEVYVLREQYTIQLDDMYDTAKAEYKAMSKTEKSPEKLAKWAMGYVNRARKLERECDAAMENIVTRMEELVRANNGDFTLVDTVVYTYASEKSLKKASYMAKLEEKGLI